MEKIGMIGTGAMGLALLERLKVAGVNAVCYDAYAPALEQAGALGMRTVGSSAEVAAESTLIDPGLDEADHRFFGPRGSEEERVPGAEAQTEKLPASRPTDLPPDRPV